MHPEEEPRHDDGGGGLRGGGGGLHGGGGDHLHDEPRAHQRTLWQQVAQPYHIGLETNFEIIIINLY